MALRWLRLDRNTKPRTVDTQLYAGLSGFFAGSTVEITAWFICSLNQVMVATELEGEGEKNGGHGNGCRPSLYAQQNMLGMT